MVSPTEYGPPLVKHPACSSPGADSYACRPSGSSEYAAHRESTAYYHHPDYAYYPAYYFAQRHVHHHQAGSAGQDWNQPS